MTTPAEQPSERELPQFWECPDCGYKMHRDHYDERLTDAQNCSACEILRLHSENESLCAERDRLQEGWIASNELVEHLRAEQKAWQAAMDQVRKLRVKQRPERTDWDRDDPDGH
jgi:FtsZ-binding cell division protein ZapB